MFLNSVLVALRLGPMTPVPPRVVWARLPSFFSVVRGMVSPSMGRMPSYSSKLAQMGW